MTFYKNISFSTFTFRLVHAFYSVNSYPVRKLFRSFLSYINGKHCDRILVFLFYGGYSIQLDLFLFSFHTYSHNALEYCIGVSWIQKRLLLLFLLLVVLTLIALQGMHFGFSFLNEKQCPHHLFLKDCPVDPIYVFTQLSEVTVAFHICKYI